MIRRLKQALFAFVLALAPVLTILFPGVAHAATGQTLTWCGADSAPFATASNWAVGNDVSCSGNTNTTAYPGSDGSSDTLVFDLSNVPSDSLYSAYDNIISLTVSSIEFTGGNGSTDGFGYDISGNSLITLTGSFTDNSIPSSGIAAGGNIINPTINISGSGSPLIFNISTDSNTTFVSIDGSTDITVQGGGTADFSGTGVAGGLTNYTGTISSSDGSMIQIANDLASGTYTSSGTVAVSGTSILDLVGGSCKISSCTYNYNFPISLSGNGNGKDSALNLDGYQSTNIINNFTGTVTLNSNVTVSDEPTNGDTTVEFSGPINFNGHSFSAAGQNIVSINTLNDANYSSENPVIGQYITYTNDGTVGSTTVNNGGTYKGAGTSNGLTVNSGGTLAPGDAPACTRVNGNFTLNGTYSPEIQSPGTTPCTDYDQTIVSQNNGSINLSGGTLNVNLLNGFNPSVGQNFDIINNETGYAITGTFNGLAEGAVFQVGTTKFQITYKGGSSGHDVVLTVVSPNTPVTSGTKAPGTPDTGFALAKFNNILPVLGAIMIAGGLLIISIRVKYFRITKR